MFRKIVGPIVKLLLLILFRIEIINKERLRNAVGLVICANHTSIWDGLLIWYYSNSNTRIMAKAESFKPKLWGDFMKAGGVFPVKREENDTEAMKFAIKSLKTGLNIAMFPEGTRNAKDKGLEPKTGAMYFATATNSPILLVYISKIKIFHKVKVIIGEKVKYEKPKKSNDKNYLSEYTNDLMEKIYTLDKK